MREITVSIPRGEDVRPGDDVDVVFDSGKLLAAAVLVYGIPLLGAILGAGVALAFAESDIVAVVGTMLGLGVGMALSRRWLLRPGCQQQYVPVVHTHTRP